MIPSSATQLLITLVLIVPGFVYHGVLIRLRGLTRADTDLPTRLLRAIVASTVFALIYLLVAGPEVEDLARKRPPEALDNVREYAFWSLFAVLIVPSLAAVLASLFLSSKPLAKFKESKCGSRWSHIDPRPSAWDVAFDEIGERFVRVQMKDGSWYAGYLGLNSYASSFPDAQSLYFEIGYNIDKKGVIGAPIEGSVGAVIDCTEAVLVELLDPSPPSGTMEDEEATT